MLLLLLGFLKIEETLQQKVIEIGSDSAEQIRNVEKPELQQRKRDGDSNLKSDAEESNSENSKNAEKEKKGQRTVVEKNQEFILIQDEEKGVTINGSSEGLVELKKKFSDNPNQQIRHQYLFTSMIQQ